jgi:phthiocerol/phenolphthiocerol synthesis type-I polyketide synthase E
MVDTAAVCAYLTDFLAEALGVERVSPDDSFADLGGDSAVALEVVVELKLVFSVDMSATEVLNSHTIEQLAESAVKRAG